MPSFRPITGSLSLPDGAVARSARVELRLQSPDWTPDRVLVPDIVRLRVDADGDLVPDPQYRGEVVEVEEKGRAVVWASEDGEAQARYTVTLRGQLASYELGVIAVPSGTSPITLQALIELGITTADPRYTTILAYLSGLWLGEWTGQAAATGATVQRSGNVYRASEDIAEPSPDPLEGGPWELYVGGFDAAYAEGLVQQAEDARDAAVAAKDDAESAATAAGGSAGAAATSAGEASDSATAAAQAESAAEGHASSASGSATAAGNSATSASGSASAAGDAQAAAESARDGAVSAQGGSEAARDGSIAARDAAVVAQGAAEDAASAAAGSASAAGDSESAAAQSASAAAGSALAAQESAGDAEAAKADAEAAAGAVVGAIAAHDAEAKAHSLHLGGPVHGGIQLASAQLFTSDRLLAMDNFGPQSAGIVPLHGRTLLTGQTWSAVRQTDGAVISTGAVATQGGLLRSGDNNERRIAFYNTANIYRNHETFYYGRGGSRTTGMVLVAYVDADNWVAAGVDNVSGYFNNTGVLVGSMVDGVITVLESTTLDFGTPFGNNNMSGHLKVNVWRRRTDTFILVNFMGAFTTYRLQDDSAEGPVVANSIGCGLMFDRSDAFEFYYATLANNGTFN